MKPLGLNGGVQLGCRTNSDGVPYLASQRFSPPVHLSKPYYDEYTGALLINLSCPTAGLLSGDRMICDIEVSDEQSADLQALPDGPMPKSDEDMPMPEESDDEGEMMGGSMAPAPISP